MVMKEIEKYTKENRVKNREQNYSMDRREISVDFCCPVIAEFEEQSEIMTGNDPTEGETKVSFWSRGQDTSSDNVLIEEGLKQLNFAAKQRLQMLVQEFKTQLLQIKEYSKHRKNP